MASDRARISYDPTRAWRSVVAQQGRVSLEADLNEASSIAQEGRRAEIIDIVGPTGTPDDGYKVSHGALGDVVVGVGTLYLGGWRLELDKPLHASAQPDWLDQSPHKFLKGHEAVLLRATEQEVGAVEDPTLREVALGGPDTAARTRLLQHVLRFPVKADDCRGAAKEVAAELKKEGLTVDPHSLQLLSSARLEVGFVPPDPPPGPCDPPAQGGYLGADNQLIRVTVTDYDPATKKGKLLWGYNNASFLYRASTSAADTLVLASDPLDSEHEPKVGQPVEVLRTRVALGGDNYVAAPVGEIRVLTAPYQPDPRTVTLPSALPAEYVNDPNGPLFVRLWRAEVDFTSGQPAVLDPSGIEVTVTLDALPTLAGRPFWTFSVRPSTPVKVYPSRYADAPQPPEGPRQWLCELAVISWRGRTLELLDDCRIPFLPLTKLKNDGCCSIVAGPEHLSTTHGLQNLIDQAMRQGGRTVSLRPGLYELKQPLVLGPQHAGLVLEGCSDGAVLQADAKASELFADGLIVMQEANEVTLRNLRLELPLVRIGGIDNRRIKEAGGTYVSIGVMAVHCAELRIEDCLFRYHLPPEENLIALGIYARSECWGLELRRNSFLHDEDYERGTTAERFLIGYGLTPDTRQTKYRDVITRGASITHGDSGAQPDARLENALIVNNRFQGLTAAVLVMARMGLIECVSNRVRDCLGGFFFFSSNLGATLELARRVEGGDDLQVEAGFRASVNLELLYLAANLGAWIPLPPPLASSGTGRKPITITKKALGLMMTELRKRAHEAMIPASEVKTKAAEATDQPAAPEAPAPAAPLEEVSVKTFAQDRSEYFNHVIGVAAQAHLLGVTARPVLHIKDNDIEAVGLMPRKATSKSRGTLPAGGEIVGGVHQLAPVELALAGINVVFEYGDDDAELLAQGNRVRMASQSAPAAGVLASTNAVATGNMFIQSGGPLNRSAVCFTLIGSLDDNCRIDVMANLVRGTSVILPHRGSSLDTSSWEFLNAIG